MSQRKFNNATPDEWLAWIAKELEPPRVGHAEDPAVVHVLKGFQATLEEIARMQARIDELMLEFCPSEMMPEQIKQWGECQHPVQAEEDEDRDAEQYIKFGLREEDMP